MDRAELERLGREGLIARAEAAGLRRARLLTRPELIDELLRRDPALDSAQLRRNRGFFGIAKDLLSRVVERGLHLPDAADRLRAALGTSLPHVPRPEPQAVPTVTLAEIYAAQGHRARAIETLRRVLDEEPEHAAARALLDKLEALTYVAPEPPLPPEEERAPRADAPVEEQAPVTPAPVTLAPWSEEPQTLVRGVAHSECVAVPVDRGRLLVWWQLSPSDRRSTEAGLVVRAVVLFPTWDGPRRETRDVACGAADAEVLLSQLPEGAVVRVAIGVGDGAAFTPLAHSPALEASVAGLVEWTMEGRFPATRRSVTRAVERARRYVGE